MRICQALRVRENQVIAFVGGGGKTTTMFCLADELFARGKRVAITTTTRLGADEAAHWPALQYDAAPDFLERIHAVLANDSRAMIVGAPIGENKVTGVPPQFVDALAAFDDVDAVVYEADGSRRLPFKAPAKHEPVIAASTTLIVPVVGASVFGTALDDAHVHRAEIVAALAGARIGEPVSPLMIARVLAHPAGGLKGKPPGARGVVLVNQVENATQIETARLLAQSLLGFTEINAVAIGAVMDAANPIREIHRRVAAIVLAAGGSTRMEGRVKQLLSWRGKTLIENAVAIAQGSNAQQVTAVLGAHADQIRPLIKSSGVRVALNRQWMDGHSTSIRAALNSLSPEFDAVVFINADQPLLSSQAINAILQRYRETDAGIIVSSFAGRRGSPVLFDRTHFVELMSLQGEEGGRELFAHHPVERVEFEDARMGIDVDTFDEYQAILHN